jgi:hypothetical protein
MNGSSPALLYKLGYTILGHGDWHNTSQDFAAMEPLQAQVTGLHPGTDYQIRKGDGPGPLTFCVRVCT